MNRAADRDGLHPIPPYSALSDEATDIIARTLYQHRYGRGPHSKAPLRWESSAAVFRRMACRATVDYLALHGMLNPDPPSGQHAPRPAVLSVQYSIRRLRIVRARRASALVLVRLARSIVTAFPPAQLDPFLRRLRAELDGELDHGRKGGDR
jgi:hypothetical protein